MILLVQLTRAMEIKLRVWPELLRATMTLTTILGIYWAGSHALRGGTVSSCEPWGMVGRATFPRKEFHDTTPARVGANPTSNPCKGP